MGFGIKNHYFIYKNTEKIINKEPTKEEEKRDEINIDFTKLPKYISLVLKTSSFQWKHKVSYFMNPNFRK